MVSEAVLDGARVIGFAPTRKAASSSSTTCAAACDDRDPDGDGRVLPYRAGYTPQQRRDIERRLFDHELDAVIATSALELGIDVGSLDLSLVTGFPGTVTSLKQRWGRAGRAGHGWAVLVAGQDALDQYFMREPERLLSRQVEEAIIDLDNPHIFDAHLQSAAYERPLTADDVRYFGETGMLRGGGSGAGRPAAAAGRRPGLGQAALARRRRLPALGLGRDASSSSRRPTARSSAPSSRSASSASHTRAPSTCTSDGAISWSASTSTPTPSLVQDFTGTFYTQTKIDKNVRIAGQGPPRPLAGAALFFGEIEVSEQVIAYQKRDMTDGRVMDTVPLDLPEQSFTTEALWFTLGPEVVDRVVGDLRPEPSPTRSPTPARAAARRPGGHVDPQLAGALHAAEHGLIALVPLYAMCDRWDIGGLSTPWHWQTDRATVFIYDGYPGGIGLSKRAFEAFEQLAADTRRLISECPCESGCPSCVQSPKCGNLNEPLSKVGAVRLLEAILGGPGAVVWAGTLVLIGSRRRQPGVDRRGGTHAGRHHHRAARPGRHRARRAAVEGAARPHRRAARCARADPPLRAVVAARARRDARGARGRCLRARRAPRGRRRRLRLRPHRGTRPRLVHRRQPRRPWPT